MMLFTKTTFIGIDPTAGVRPFVYAALDFDLELLALGTGSLEDVMAFAAGQHQAVVAVCAPRGPNLGVMQQSDVRQSLTPQPQPGRWENFRLVEYLLRMHRINIPQTPSDEAECPNWMRMGFVLHRRLEALGYSRYPQADADLLLLEVYPHGSYTAILELVPFQKRTLEGRLQRQLALYDRQVSVPDAMRLFEEITRHRLLTGILPMDDLFSTAELDALVGAYTAWLAATQPEQVTLLGDPDEGQVVLPAAELKAHY